MSDTTTGVREVETCNYCKHVFCSAGDIEAHQIINGESYCDDCIPDVLAEDVK